MQIFKTALEFGDKKDVLENKTEINGKIEPNINLIVKIDEIDSEINQHQIISLVALIDFFGSWSAYKP
jgi:hypothetical protein